MQGPKRSPVSCPRLIYICLLPIMIVIIGAPGHELFTCLCSRAIRVDEFRTPIKSQYALVL
jgi:hypothetical protein